MKEKVKAEIQFPQRVYSLLPGQEVVIGRGREAQPKMVECFDTDQEVIEYISGKHCRISFADGMLQLVDLGSTNGTCLNGIPLQPHERHCLNHGDTILLAQDERLAITVNIQSKLEEFPNTKDPGGIHRQLLAARPGFLVSLYSSINTSSLENTMRSFVIKRLPVLSGRIKYLLFLLLVLVLAVRIVVPHLSSSQMDVMAEEDNPEPADIEEITSSPPQALPVDDVTEATNFEYIRVEEGSVSFTINAAGQVEISEERNLTFGVNGVVSEVMVEPGQPVTAGMVLARLEATDLEFAVRRADARLRETEAGLEELLAGPNQDELTSASVELRQAQIRLQHAQWAYDAVAWGCDGGACPQAAELEQATLAFEAAKARFNMANSGPKAAEIERARIAVELAEINLLEARYNLAKATLVAPMDGVVTTLNLKPGEMTQAQVAIVVSDLANLELNVWVDEIDIGQVAVGQDVTITLDAIPGQTFTGQVSHVYPIPINKGSGGVVAYKVLVNFLSNDERLKSGLSANARIETQRLENVLVVPNQAIQNDYKNGLTETYVEKLDDEGKPTRVPVTLGLRGDTFSQVLMGLEKNDQVVVRHQGALPETNNSILGGN